MLVAAICTASVAGWQALTVHYNFDGNWTALFRTGSVPKGVPPALKDDSLYVFGNSGGYDGQFYHYLAHDPLLRRNFSAFMDDPRYRAHRILVPGLAFLAAFGRDENLDAAYFAVVWFFVALGAYWLGRLAVLYSYSAWLGLGFALVPAVLVSMDRLTVDVALAACCVGFVLYVEEPSPVPLYVVLTTAGLVRETGLLLTLAYCAYLATSKSSPRFQYRAPEFLRTRFPFLNRARGRAPQNKLRTMSASERIASAAIFASSAIPTLAWWAYVNLHVAEVPEGSFLSIALFAGLAGRILHPDAYPETASVAVRQLAVALDFVALAGIVAALLWAGQRAWQRAWSPVTIAVYLFALLAIALNKGDAWSETFAFGRTLTPLLLLAALDGMTIRSALPAFAMLALDPRIGVEMGGQILNVAREIFS